MGKAKHIKIAPIAKKDADAIVKKIHYSGKVVPNSQLHFGVWYNGKIEGAMQFGPSLDKKKTINLVKGTKWNGFLELNRLAFSDNLPDNSESRAISIAIKIISKEYPHIEWVISFADATQCGDGTIYRAAGFILTQIKKNTSIWKNKQTGELMQNMQFFHTKTLHEKKSGKWEKMPGFQLRYIYFINPKARKRLSVAELPYSEIDRVGANMYKGSTCAPSADSGTPDNQSGGGGAIPTGALQNSEGQDA